MTTSLLDGILQERSGRETLEEIVKIADLFSFLISFALKKEEQESSLDFVIVMIREGLFSLEQRTKACFMSFRVSFDSGDNTSPCNLGKCECVLSSCDWI